MDRGGDVGHARAVGDLGEHLALALGEDGPVVLPALAQCTGKQ